MKCFFCKKDIPKGEGYEWIHVSKTGKQYKRHCCSLEEKEQIEREKELYKLCQYETDSILNRPITNNVRNKELQELHEQYSYETILRCIKSKANDIKQMIEYNSIENDYQQIRYMMQVIKNCIFDFSVEDAKQQDWEQYKKVEEYADENTNTLIEETDEDVKNRLNKKQKSNGFSDLLNKFK